MVKYSESYWKEVNEVLACVPEVSKLTNKSILITGATGMICSTVVELLFELNRKCNAHIKIILAGRSRQRIHQRFHGFTEGKDYQFLEYDATNDVMIDACPDYMIHGASPADPAAIMAQPVETMFSNLYGLRTLLDVAKQHSETRLLYISSSEVYGKKSGGCPFMETDYGFVDILNPRASYPTSKRAAETMCAAYHKEYGVDFVVVRPGHIYGPTITDADSRASAQFTRLASQGENIVMKSAGTQLRSYCYTMDCASAILTVLLRGECGEAYNISNPQSIVSIRDLAEGIAKVAGVNLVFEQSSEQERNSYNLMDNSSLSSKKLESLGWKGVYNLSKGVQSTLKYYG